MAGVDRQVSKDGCYIGACVVRLKPAVFAAEMNAVRAAPAGARQCIAASIWARAKILS
jgi:hypothetical protein